jgi:peptide/nickel transport system substrate-binding protein
MSQKKLSRREFLRLSALGAAGVALSACAKKATEAAVVEPTKAPATEAPKATAVSKEPTPIPTQGPTATLVPTVEVSKYKEAPALAELVKAGKLPKIEERLPKVPLTLSPVNKIGNYGGRWKWDIWWLDGGMSETQYGWSPLRWIDDGMGIAPGMIESWDTNADNTLWTLHFREGLKWSDGQPCTTADVMSWWNDRIQKSATDTLPDAPPDFGTAGGVLAEFTAVDDYTLTIKYAESAPLTAKRLAMWVNQNQGPKWIVPKHYMDQFHPKYNTQYTDFKMWDQKYSVSNNPELPSLCSWVVSKYDPSKSSNWDRNPYYYCVDTEGNQLPYIDGVDVIANTDRQAVLLSIMQGGDDFLVFTYQLTLEDIAPLKQSESKGDYKVNLWDTGSGTGMMYFWDYDIQDDKKRELYRNPKFKLAMSFALDRPSIQKIVYYDTGMISTGTMSPKAIEFNFNDDARAHYKKFRDLASAYDPVKSEALLDEIGMKKGADGLRTYPDGTECPILIDVPADAGGECIKVLEIAEKNWKAVGLNLIINQMPGSEFDVRWKGGKGEIHTNWEVGDGPDHLLYPSWVVPNEPERWAPLCGRLLQYQGTDKETSEADKSPWDREPPRFNKNDPQYKGSAVEKIHALYEKAKIEVDEVKRMELVWQMNDIHMSEGTFFIGTVCNTPRIVIVSNKMENVPTKEQLKLGGFCNPWIIPYPAVVNPETFSFK